MNIFVAVLLFFFAFIELTQVAKPDGDGLAKVFAVIFAGLAIWAGVWAVSA